MAAKLTAAFVRTVDRPGKYGDQHGVILRALPSGSKQWIWRGTVCGRRCDRGLGGYPYVSLAEARQAAFDHRKLARAGGEPHWRARARQHQAGAGKLSSQLTKAGPIDVRAEIARAPPAWAPAT